LLYYINNKNKTELKPVKPTNLKNIGWYEKDLENLISENIAEIILENQLMVLFQQKPFKEAADIYALDIEGNMHIFELKRWSSDQENLLQVLRYGQIYGQYDYKQLEKMLRKYKEDSSLSLQNKHYEYFKEDLNGSLEMKDFNKEQYFVIVTNGIDMKTLNAIKYWENNGLKIDYISYKVYRAKDEYIMEFYPYNPDDEVLIQDETNSYIVNTNLTWSDKNYKQMLNQNKAAAYGDRRKAINNISCGDKVFLYHNGIGIIAYGEAENDPIKKNSKEYYVDLDFEWKIDPDEESEKAISAQQINQALGAGYRFRNTVFSIPDEFSEVILKLIKK